MLQRGCLPFHLNHATRPCLRLGFSIPSSRGQAYHKMAAPTDTWWQRHGTKTHAIAPPNHPTYDIQKVIDGALAEDAGDLGDITTLSTIEPSVQACATFLAKDEGVLAGIALAEQVFRSVDPALRVQWSLQDGDRVRRGVVFGTVTGSARSILVAERIALNFMQRMSGIATATAAMVAAAQGHPAQILETRKTAPGLRVLDKWAVLIGGGCNHRMGLYDMMMIKDNHIAAAGGIAAAVQRAEQFIDSHGLGGMEIEVETRTPEEVEQVVAVLGSGRAPHVTRVMLDNMARKDASQPGGVDVSALQQAVQRLGGRVKTEASGNVTIESVPAIAATGVTYISCGSLTHSVRALDISLNIETQ